jgi:tetratricopeptide (TPR) repeat protein/transcriptional regulator with XRE-family HTH domain
LLAYFCGIRFADPNGGCGVVVPEGEMAAKRQRLAQQRKAAGLSQEALAARLDVERSTVVRWESGETNPQPWIRPKLGQALGVSADQLNGLLEAMPEPPATGHDQMPWADSPAAMPLPAATPAENRPPVCQLPPAVADFTGREPQVTELTGLLSRDRDNQVGVPVAVIVGLPGVGKTALALNVAHSLRPRFPDGQLWVPLQGASGHPRDPGEVLGELCRAMGVPGTAIPASAAERAALYRSVLAGRRVLVLADDAATAAQLQPLLPGTSQCAVLVTSRSELAGPPGSRLLPLDPLTPAEAVDLLAQIVGEDRVTTEPQAAADLAAACGLLPLAVRIAGARLAARTAWPLSALTRKITHARHRLDELQAGEMSVRASLTHSYHALDEPARRAFRILALLDTGDFTEWQVSALLGTDDAASVVNQLAASSLLTAAGIDPAGQARYRLHDLLRDYAAEQLTSEPATERHTAHNRLTSAWLQLATLADARLPNEPYFPPPPPAPAPAIVPESLATDITTDPIAWFTTERLGLHAAITRCCTTGHHHKAAQLAASMASFWHLQGRPDDAERAWQAITTAAQHAGDPAATAHAQLRLTAAICGQGRHAEAGPIIDHCIQTFTHLGDNTALATAYYWRAARKWNLGAFAIAKKFAERAIHVARAAGDGYVECHALRMLALSLGNLPGHGADAVTSAEQALTLARTLGGPLEYGEAVEYEVLHTLGHVYNLAGRHEDALRLSQQGMDTARDTAIAEWLCIRSDAYRGLGRYREAAESLTVALPIFRGHFMRRYQGLCLLKLGQIYQAMGDHQTAARHLTESMTIFSQLQLAFYAERAREAINADHAGHLPPSSERSQGAPKMVIQSGD